MKRALPRIRPLFTGPRLRPSLLVRLSAMFALGGVLVVTLLLFGNRALHDAERRLEDAVIQQVRPLAATHRLQTRTNDLRTHELELPQVRDFFALPQHLERLESEIVAVAEEMEPFLALLAQSRPHDAHRLAEHWQHYRHELSEVIRHARNMDLHAAEEITNRRSRGPHAAISAILRDLVSGTESAAEDAYRQAQYEQRREQRFFLMLSFGGFVALGCGLLIFARSLSRRIGRLRHAAARLAAGQDSDPIDTSDRDEIADLAGAFNAMQNRVLERERSLRAAREELEDRVIARTKALAAANARLWMLSQAVEQNPIGVLIATMERRVEYTNPAYVRVTGRPAETLLPGEIPVPHGDDRSNSAEAALQAALVAGRDWEGEWLRRRPDGSDYWEHLRLVTVRNEHGLPAHLLLMREDVSQRRQQEEKVAYQAYYDTLTGLPNRTLALDRLGQAVSHADRRGNKCAVLFIDLDNFKQINDTLGHVAGDELLCQAADRLREVVRQEDTVARLGGDEFLVILGGVKSASDAQTAAGKIIEAFSPVFRIDGREFGASPSIGVSLYPDDGAAPPVLLRNADMAMYEAKEAGRNTYRFFNQKIHDDSVARLEMERQLRGALDRGELELHFQPLVAAKSGKLVGAEALLRWHHPELGHVSPDCFIPLAEQSGLIVSIGNWVLDEACRQAAHWRAAHGGEFVIAVNVSPRQFSGSGLVQAVRECVEKYSIPRGQLEIEVTEGLLIRNPSEVRDAMVALESLGVTVALDDFGTGYSSLSYLRAFPFHTIKIDRSFVRDISDDAEDCALVVAAIRMAHALGLRVVAEGVETEAQSRFLATLESDVLQGYLFGKPQAASAFARHWFPATAGTA
ncbi:MAG: EAL domain-containing protein [Aromatoleum sp.]|jgi:diguanylate cyclase (GGDEF)-like protein/PAS domain S-box-containing protein|uniref:EAL domain-containing protein n=1 Tax=Aromatoleum sp. TaxID=2307007 RepID=UPI0028938E24|nr:EAL domain-containing protein [Aromatoleum sp.]MDT3668843.1 EAL domain-containing protein [Aromatoleum sp.]